MPERTAYVDGLHLLGRRELSARQLRERLLEREHDRDDVDRAIELLIENKALDDASLKELADELKMSREGIRHIETRALRKLRHAVGVGVG